MQRWKDLTGQRFGRLTVIEPTDQRKAGHLVWRCRCDCGAEKLVSSQHLRSGSVTSCGCSLTQSNRKKAIDLTGNRYGKLVALEKTDQRSGNSVVWKCRCDCGNICFISAANLKNGGTTSCGCYASEVHSRTMRGNLDQIHTDYYIDGTQVPKLAQGKLLRNNTSGVTGISYDKSIDAWRAYISFRGKRYRLGARRDKDAAIALRKEAEEKIHGEFLKWYAETHPEQWAKIKKKRGAT